MSEESVKRLSELCQLLSVVHWGMQSHHRRWYYTCRDLLRISASQTRIDKLIAQRRSAERETELLKKMELLMDQESVEIHVSGGQIGSINLGTVLGNIDNNLTMVESAGQGEVAKALREIANAIRDDTHLDDEQKRELLQDVEVLSEAAQEPDEQRQKGVLKAVFEALKSGLSIAVDAGKVWTMWAPLAAKFFGL